MAMTTIDDHFFLKYRELLDAEDQAFDELEHASEDGNGPRFDEEIALWIEALRAKLRFLERSGVSVEIA